jgi:3-dehydroquinate synthase
VLAAELSARTGRIADAEVTRVRNVLAARGTSRRTAAPRAGAHAELMAMDKKVKGGEIRLVLLDGIGKAVVTADYPRKALEALLDERTGT